MVSQVSIDFSLVVLLGSNPLIVIAKIIPFDQGAVLPRALLLNWMLELMVADFVLNFGGQLVDFFKGPRVGEEFQAAVKQEHDRNIQACLHNSLK